MPRASIDLDELERGTGASHVLSVACEAARPEPGQDGGGGTNVQGSSSTTISHAAVEDEIDPGK